MKRYIIPIFIPHHGCPHKCVFCDQLTITGAVAPVCAADVAAEIAGRLVGVTLPRLVEIAFYGGSFTALPVERQRELLAPAKAALDRGQAAAIRVSTRPDAVDDAAVANLLAFGVSTVELGAQSFDDAVLAAAERGHTARQTAEAVAVLKASGLACGLQLMPGLPGEDWPSLIATLRYVLALRPDFIRIYPAVVLAGTPLADLYAAGRYRPLTMAAAVARAAYVKISCENGGIKVIRVGLQASEELDGGAVVAGPYSPDLGARVEAFVFYHLVTRLLERLQPPDRVSLVIRHHFRDESALRGHRNANLAAWRKAYQLAALELRGDWPRRGEVAAVCRGIMYVANKSMIFTS